MASVWGELKRRNVVKVAMAYAIVAWLIVQIIVSVEAPLNLPDSTDTLVIVFLAIGFVVAIFLAWAYELTPEGMRQTKAVPLAESVARVTGRKLDFAIIGLLVLAVGFMFVDNYLLPESSESSVRTGDVLPSSVAVLPFENLSPNADDAYFAAGLHEEVLNQLSKLRDLSVISRTSVLRYSGSGLSIPEIARELNVGSIMEGSVRYANDRVRITMQLIDAVTDEHLWSETYDREFADIFAIETDIALNVVSALEAAFAPEVRERLERPATTSPAAYQLYLRAVAVVGLSSTFRTPGAVSAANAYLDQALAIDPQFALAYVRRSRLAPLNAPASARENAEKAISIDPNLGFAHFALAGAHTRDWRTTEAREEYERALELSPNEPEIIGRFAELNSILARHDEAIRLARRAIALDPNNSAWHNTLGTVLSFAGDLDQAADSFLRSTILDPTSFGSLMNLGRTEAARGNQVEAVKFLQAAEQLLRDDQTVIGFVAHGYSLAGLPDKAVELATRARTLEQRGLGIGDGLNALVSLILGDTERALALLNRIAEHRAPLGLGVMRIKYNVYSEPALSEPEFSEVLERISLTQ